MDNGKMTFNIGFSKVEYSGVNNSHDLNTYEVQTHQTPDDFNKSFFAVKTGAKIYLLGIIHSKHGVSFKKGGELILQ